jgi:hypothetical protein
MWPFDDPLRDFMFESWKITMMIEATLAAMILALPATPSHLSSKGLIAHFVVGIVLQRLQWQWTVSQEQRIRLGSGTLTANYIQNLTTAPSAPCYPSLSLEASKRIQSSSASYRSFD